MQYLLSHNTLRNSWMDGGFYKLISRKEQEILKKLFASDVLTFAITNLSSRNILMLCSIQFGKENARKLISELKKSTKILNVKDEHLVQARALSNKYFDFEDALDVVCVQSYDLDGLVTHIPHQEHFEKMPVKILTLESLLDHLPKRIKLWADYTIDQRRDFRDVSLNLQEEDLKGVNLSGTDFSGQCLAGVNFMDATLTEADFTGADLSEACLINTNLTGAILRNANLQGADLTRTNFTGSDLRGADLSGAHLEDTILTHTKVAGINFITVDVSEVTLGGMDFTVSGGHSMQLAKDFTVRNIATKRELRQVHRLETFIKGDASLTYEELEKWWDKYPYGIKALFYQQKIVVGVFDIWAMCGETMLNLEERISNTKDFQENELEPCASRRLRLQNGTKYFYLRSLYLNESFRVKGNLRITFLAFLLYEAYQIWIGNEGKFIDESGPIELYALDCGQHLQHANRGIFKVLEKWGFQKLPGMMKEGSQLYKLSQPLNEVMARLEKYFFWWTRRMNSLENEGEGKLPAL